MFSFVVANWFSFVFRARYASVTPTRCLPFVVPATDVFLCSLCSLCCVRLSPIHLSDSDQVSSLCCPRDRCFPLFALFALFVWARYTSVTPTRCLPFVVPATDVFLCSLCSLCCVRLGPIHLSDSDQVSSLCCPRDRCFPLFALFALLCSFEPDTPQ